MIQCLVSPHRMISLLSKIQHIPASMIGRRNQIYLLNLDNISIYKLFCYVFVCKIVPVDDTTHMTITLFLISAKYMVPPNHIKDNNIKLSDIT